eukprot:TRINITY_DN13581_c0_g1_i1.p1 TRINITY_DN13581_c0_g1~~TRINITY_DN13581_c0_g1_i1.p1  ORF type:complete len:433 (-),score=81.54 TRINITY_DN13581_c0_g1_i1:15-1286(-)
MAKYDIILWGATGFTGELCAIYLAENYPTQIRWAIAARDAKKLEELKTKLVKINPKLNDVDTLTAESLNKASMENLAAQTSVILSTVGPYAKFGTPLIEACLKHGTHYLDVSGEHSWMREILDKYHNEAKEKKVCFVPTCGFDSAPADIGTFFMLNHLAEKYPDDTCVGLKGVVEGQTTEISGGSTQTLMNSFSIPADKAKEGQLYNVLNDDYDRNSKKTVDKRDADQMLPEYNNDFKSWTVPFLMEIINSRVVRRSQSLMKTVSKKTKDDPLYKYYFDLHYTESQLSKSVIGAFISWFLMMFLVLLITFQSGRNLAQKYLLPKPGSGPSQQSRSKHPVTYWFVATLASGLKVFGAYKGNEMYEETAKLLVEGGICLVEKNNLGPLAAEGGFLTPATCLGNALVQRLQKTNTSLTIEKSLPKN